MKKSMRLNPRIREDDTSLQKPQSLATLSIANAKILFISDLHLSEKTKKINEIFHTFLTEIAPTATALFILGDFFEYWLGADVQDAFQTNTLERLKTLSDQGLPIYFIHGNRDFLLSKACLARYGITLLPDVSCMTLCGKKVLLCHGDHLCTDDLAYQRYKKIAHLPFVKWLFLHLPQKTRENIAQKLRQQQPRNGALREMADATEVAIQAEINREAPDLIIHGHTHRMNEHLHGTTPRIVLGDWRPTQGNYLELTPSGRHLRLLNSE